MVSSRTIWKLLNGIVSKWINVKTNVILSQSQRGEKFSFTAAETWGSTLCIPVNPICSFCQVLNIVAGLSCFSYLLFNAPARKRE